MTTGLTALVAGLSLAASANAATLTASTGASFSQHDWTPVAALDLAGSTHAIGAGALQWQPVASLTFVSGHQRNWRPDTDRSVWIGAGGVALSMREHGGFLALQTGSADRTTPALSSHLQFVSSLGWHGAHWQVQLRHISNGRVGGGPNLGETMLLLGLRL